MLRWIAPVFLILSSLLTSCQTAQQAREIKLLSFDEDVSKGKSLGPIEGGDCVYHVLGYWLGGQPTLQRAVMNARVGKTSSIADSGGSSRGIGGPRYFNNAIIAHEGFDVGIFGKNCIYVTAVGYK